MKLACTFWTHAGGVQSAVVEVDAEPGWGPNNHSVRKRARAALQGMDFPPDLILEALTECVDGPPPLVERRPRGYGGCIAYGPALTLVAGGQWWASIELLGLGEFEPRHEVASLSVQVGDRGDEAGESERHYPLIAMQADQVRALRDACSAWLDDRPGL